MKVTRKQVVALWDAMVGWIEVGVDCDGNTSSRPKAREVQAVIATVDFGGANEFPFPSSVAYEGGAQAHQKLREFFLACAAALEIE